MLDKDSTLLFQGDSITDGGRSRNDDLNHVMGHGYAYLIASRLQADYPERNLHIVNRGVSGNRIVDLYARWKEDALNLKPNILSILIGVNDVYHELRNQSGVTAERYSRVYELLLEETKAALPAATIVLCEPFILQVGEVKRSWDLWHPEMVLRQQIVKEMADKFACLYVPLQQVFDTACQSATAAYWLWDGFHPTPAGHELIARQWMKCVSEQYGK
jgi:lysophospholipase L1-like esterase